MIANSQPCADCARPKFVHDAWKHVEGSCTFVERHCRECGEIESNHQTYGTCHNGITVFRAARVTAK